MELDTEKAIFNDEMYKKYLSMHANALNKQNSLIKSLVLIDALLALLISGKDIVIPGISVRLLDIPAAPQLFVVMSSVIFLLSSLSFLNSQLYGAILEQFCIEKAKKIGVDPDFIIASDILVELYLKIFRKDMHIQGADFFRAGNNYVKTYSIVLKMIAIIMLILIFLHVSLEAYAIYYVFSLSFFGIFIPLFATVCTGVAVFVNMMIDFTFTTNEI
jgi:hypothetical protein